MRTLLYLLLCGKLISVAGQEACPYRMAVVTALVGNREGSLSIFSVADATHRCTDY